MNFVHLHVHSQYSFLDGVSRIKELTARAAAMGMPALALTDINGLYGAIEFYQMARNYKIKPIIGCQFDLTARGRQ